MTETIRVGSKEVSPGTRAHLELPVARLFTGTWLSLPVAVLHGATPGPRLWLSATIHGDELNGVEIIREVLRELDPSRLRGVVIAVPVVNVFGFIEQDRYLPDRRDLNRSFPGSARGSLAARLAHLMMKEVVAQCQYGIDFHTGSLHRENLPQIRADLDDAEARRLAEAFGAPLIYKAPPIRGTLRSAAKRRGVCYLLYEGGEPLRFNDHAITAGVAGTLRVLDALDMWPLERDEAPPRPFEAARTTWLRASRSGIFQHHVSLGQRVERGEVLGHIALDFFSTKTAPVKASFGGLVMGFTNNPLVSRGDALVHLAKERVAAGRA